MTKLKDQMVRLVRNNARTKVGYLASQFVRAAPEEKEVIQAAIDFERWLAESCDECLTHRPER